MVSWRELLYNDLQLIKPERSDLEWSPVENRAGYDSFVRNL